MIGVAAAAVAIGAILNLLNAAWGFGSEQLGAPQATMMKMVIEGVMGGNLPWALVFTGVFIAVVLEILGLPVLPIAIGIYLPIHLNAGIMLGGVVRWLVEKRKYKSEKAQNDAVQSGVLYASGMIAGEGLVGILLAAMTALVLFGGIKRIGAVAETMVPVMAAIYILCSLVVVCSNLGAVGKVFVMIFKGAFSAEAALGGAFGITIMTTIQKGVGRGVFSNEAGLGSAPMAHASSSERDPVKQGLYGIFEVFMDTIVICTLTALTLLCGAGDQIVWGQSAGAELISASFSSVFGAQLGSMLVAVGISLFALSTILSWSLYGTRCCEFLLGSAAARVYQVIFVAVILVGATLKLDLVWNIADTLNGFMAVPNLVALLGLSPVVIKLTREHFAK